MIAVQYEILSFYWDKSFSFQDFLIILWGIVDFTFWNYVLFMPYCGIKKTLDGNAKKYVAFIESL